MLPSREARAESYAQATHAPFNAAAACACVSEVRCKRCVDGRMGERREEGKDGVKESMNERVCD